MYKNRGFIFKISWLWLVIIVIAVWSGPYVVEFFHIAHLKRQAVIDTFVIGLTLTAISSIAIAWHRSLVLEKFSGGFFHLKLDGVVLRYAITLAVITLVAVIFGYFVVEALLRFKQVFWIK